MSEEIAPVKLGSVTIRDAAAFQAQLAERLDDSGPLHIDASGAERVDTATLQLLTAFVRDLKADGRQVVGTACSPSLQRAPARSDSKPYSAFRLTHSERRCSMNLDLAQFHATFFEESIEALDGMEAALLKLDVGAPNPEDVNTIFRVAHSIKGGGQSVSVGTETYIVPLTSIIESLQRHSQNLSRLSGRGEVFSFRGDYLPIVRLHEVFGVKPRTRDLHKGVIVVAEGDGRRVGPFVDDLLGQQQVVIKSIETNYGAIDGVVGPTILGDGSVALILDLPGLIRVASHRAAA